MQAHTNRRLVIKQVAFLVTALALGAVYAGAVFATVIG